MSDFFKTHFTQFGQDYISTKITPPECKCGFPCIINENLDNFFDSNYTCGRYFRDQCDFCKPLKDHSEIAKMFYNETNYSKFDSDYAESKQCSLTKINRNVELEMKIWEDAKNDTIQTFHDIYMNKIKQLEDEITQLKSDKLTKSPKNWNKFEVVDWLNSIGDVYKQYNKIFLDNNITGDILFYTTFSANDLYILNITNEVHRKRIMYEVSKLITPEYDCDY